ncbi:MAG: tRNA uracil 4-sulfurtransferase ThiI [Candidatus Bipolaricaulia bacterium]
MDRARTDLILIRLSGDLTTKAKGTRRRFQDRLVHNLEDALKTEGIAYTLRKAWSRLYVEAPDERALELIPRVFGVQSISPVEVRAVTGLDDIVRDGEQLFKDQVAGKRFAVRARRTGEHDFSSMDVQRSLGAALNPYARVDLDDPQVTVRVEIRGDRAYFFTDRIAGFGGLPIGVEDRAVALVSGGFDSAVASWMMLKRGVLLDYVFCNLGGVAHEHGVLQVMKVLADRWSYGYRPQIHLVTFDPVLEAIQSQVQPRYWQLILKRLMYRVAERIANRNRTVAIITGEAVGQVSSQTLANLHALSGIVELPILRPLLGFDKNEIMAYARRIGTYELSATVKEYCAIVPHHPATRARRAVVDRQEEKLDLSLLDPLIAERRVLDLRSLTSADLEIPALEISEIPEGAQIIDLRNRQSYETWHYPEAVHMDFTEVLRSYTAFERGKTYILYCEWGLKSTHLAELMRDAGYQAYNFQGGLKRLLRYAAERDLIPPEVVPFHRL